MFVCLHIHFSQIKSVKFNIQTNNHIYFIYIIYINSGNLIFIFY